MKFIVYPWCALNLTDTDWSWEINLLPAIRLYGSKDEFMIIFSWLIFGISFIWEKRH